MYEYERLQPGMDAWDAGQRMRETLPLVRQLWEGDCAHEGTYHSFPKSSSAPKPLQENGPPIWVAARDPNSHEFAIKNGFDVQVTPLWQGIEEITNLMETFKAARDAHANRDTKIMLLHHTYVASNDTDTALAAQELSRFYNYFGAWFQNKRSVEQGLLQELTPDELAANKMMSPENMHRDLTIGTVQEVIDQIKRYEDLGFDEFAFWIDSGMSAERKRASLDRFINDVMPAFT
jgi:alkanesulfonate monooxygenase SsuD/methylene tetrahydromethanopterin reductase-like flavin-dependent oxidoreductase (luciferase family)